MLDWNFYKRTCNMAHDYYIRTLNQSPQKDPHAKEAVSHNLITVVPKRFHPVKFVSINVELVEKAASRTRGGLTSCLPLINLGTAQMIYVWQFLTWLKSFLQRKKLRRLACILLYKNPCLRPIRIGELFRRIVRKVVMPVVRDDLMISVGSLRVYAGRINRTRNEVDF